MSYRNNELIKRPNEITEYTPEQVLELKRCASDPVYFIRRYVKIQHPIKGTVPFDLYDYQEKMIRSYQEERFVVVLSSRQTGKCVLHNTRLNIIQLPLKNLVKKSIIWLLDRKLYNELFKNTT